VLAPIPADPRRILATRTGRGETYLLDDTLCTNRVPIVELGYIGSVLELIDCLLELGLGVGLGQGHRYEKGVCKVDGGRS